MKTFSQLKNLHRFSQVKEHKKHQEECFRDIIEKIEIAYAMLQDDDCNKNVEPSLQDDAVPEVDLKGWVSTDTFHRVVRTLNLNMHLLPSQTK